ncbi:DUF4242 domain-containing protein [Gillisia sp. M10.2A]|uniref:DUF4242 domain-containing protein n=1 Tax=Gillisia lutea TaxID=2909668 RepID=A0ABS9EIF5_9FLAO|nr:nickel-binding protein [Gillisia lutea]MCF4101565.1 DUF4242 domain-containing protein [Gillisia lutea]
MDRHDVSEAVTAEIVAQLHKEDLKIEHKYGCRGLTYWFDDKRKTAFCLVEAPNIEAIKKMHDQAHGDVPHMIIEVDDTIVESFLGRIEDPVKAQNTELNIINDPAFRSIMVVKFKPKSLEFPRSTSQNESLQDLHNSFSEIITSSEGRIVKQQLDDYLLISFKSVTHAVSSALAIQSHFKEFSNTFRTNELQLNIGICCGIPVTEKKGIFEDTIKLSEWLCDVVQGEIVLSADVKDLYESEHRNTSLNKEGVTILSSSNEKFLHILMDYTEQKWNKADLKMDDFSKHLGFSKSQLYRKMMALTNTSPNNFLKKYRLQQSLKLLKSKTGNISEIAFETGFNSPAYFSKCFQEKFGILPSKYIHS